MTQTPVQPSPQPPVAKKIPALRTHHGDAFEDNYEWLRDKESAEVVELLKAENAYQEAVTAHQEPLREAIFGEIKSRTQETDLSVPNRKDGWWYFTRSVEGKEYGIQCRVRAQDTGDRVADWTPPAVEVGVEIPGAEILATHAHLLVDESEIALIRKLAEYPRLIEGAALALEPHRLAFYLYELATALHGQWNRGTENADLRFLKVNEPELTYARLGLVQAVSCVLASGLALIGAEAPEEMR